MGDSYNTTHLSACVEVGRGVVQNLGEGPVPVPQGHRVVDGRSFAEHQHIDPVGFSGVCEVLGEVGPDELVAGDASDFDGGLADVGDLAFVADRSQ